MKQRGFSLLEVSIAITIGMGVLAMATFGVRQYRQNALNAQAVLSLREITRQAAAIFGGGRTGYPEGTIVPQELVRAARLPATIETLPTAGRFILPGGVQADVDVLDIAGGTRNSEMRIRLTFAEAGGADGVCRHLARAVRGWATRVWTPTGSPVDGTGQWLAPGAYETFFDSRCAVDGAAWTAFFR